MIVNLLYIFSSVPMLIQPKPLTMNHKYKSRGNFTAVVCTLFTEKPVFYPAYARLNFVLLGLRCIADTVLHFRLPFSKHQVPCP